MMFTIKPEELVSLDGKEKGTVYIDNSEDGLFDLYVLFNEENIDSAKELCKDIVKAFDGDFTECDVMTEQVSDFYNYRIHLRYTGNFKSLVLEEGIKPKRLGFQTLNKVLINHIFDSEPLN